MADWGEASVRVTGVRRSKFIEFDFSIGEELVVELVMPYPEFRSFCEERQARMLPADGEAALEFMRLAESVDGAGSTGEPPSSSAPTTDDTHVSSCSSNRPRAGEEDTR